MKKYSFIIILVLAFFAALYMVVPLLGDSFTAHEETRYEQLERIFGVQSKEQCYQGRLGDFCEKIDAPIPADALKREYANLDECVQNAARQHLNVDKSPLTIGNVASMQNACETEPAAEKSKADSAVIKQAQKQVIENLPIR